MEEVFMATSKSSLKKKPKIAAKATKKPIARKKKKPTSKKSNKAALAVNPSQRLKMIEESAYFIAQKHNFALGREMDNWLEAEAKVDKLLIKT